MDGKLFANPSADSVWDKRLMLACHFPVKAT